MNPYVHDLISQPVTLQVSELTCSNPQRPINGIPTSNVREQFVEMRETNEFKIHGRSFFSP